MTNEIERIKAYIARRKQSRGLDINEIHGFDVSPTGGFELKVSDIESLIAKVESLAADAERWRKARSLLVTNDFPHHYLRCRSGAEVNRRFDSLGSLPAMAKEKA